MEPEDPVLAQMRKGILEYCVLAHLRDRPSYGLEIATTLGSNQVLFASEGTLYPLLSRLRSKGLLETTWQESTEGPPRRYYTLTSAGHAALRTFMGTWERFRDAVDGELGG